MENILEEKKKIIKSIDTDDARFIIKVMEAFQKNEIEINAKMAYTRIILKDNQNFLEKNIIDLDKIWAKPYFYTRMRVKLEEIVTQVLTTDNSEIMKNPSKFCKKTIFNHAEKNFEKPKNSIDIVEFIQSLDGDFLENYIFIAEKIDEETLFKENQIRKAIEIIKIKDLAERNSKIYDEVYEYLDKDFISNKYCDFKNNKCIAQRKYQIYPINRKNGCCFMQIRGCPNLKEGNCTVQCLPCRLFACPYLTKRGIGYWANEIVLLKSFFNKEQRKHLVFDFYEPKMEILKKINRE